VVIAGMVMLAAGIGLALYLVSTVVYGTTAAVVTSVVVVALSVSTWFVLPRVLHEVQQSDREP
jgi:hypothetical protein